jgi:anti-sigma-K factor RskA
VDAHELTTAYALHALDAEERARYEAHLAQCERCRSELAELTESAAALAWAVEPAAPSPALRARILEAAGGGGANVVPFRRRVRAWQAAAAVAACAAIGLGVWAAMLDHRGSTLAISAIVPLSGHPGMIELAPNREAVLVVERLPAAPAGKTYEAWVIPHGGAPHRAGTFAGGGPMTMLKLGMRVPRDAVVAATLERSGGVDAPTTAPMFSART